MGERGHVAIPEPVRNRIGLRCGDEVVIHAERGRIIVEPVPSREDLAAGYRQRADRDRELASELNDLGREADVEIGEAPDR